MLALPQKYFIIQRRLVLSIKIYLHALTEEFSMLHFQKCTVDDPYGLHSICHILHAKKCLWCKLMWFENRLPMQLVVVNWNEMGHLMVGQKTNNHMILHPDAF